MIGIIKDGFRSALVKFFRIIFFALIILIIAFIYGALTNKKVSALSYKAQLYDPDINNKFQSFDFWSGQQNNWFYFGFAQNWTNNTDYDLIGFHLNRFQVINYKSGSSTVYDAVNPINITGILWGTDNYGYPCYLSSNVEDTILCPIHKGTSYNGMTIIANAIPTNTDYILHLDLEIERNRYFYNYDSTDVIEYFESGSGMSGIITQQQQTNKSLDDISDSINDTNSYITDGNIAPAQQESDTALSGISSSLNDTLNGWGGQYSSLTHVLLEPINVGLYALDSGTQCTPITLTIPFVQNNNQLTIPCMSTIYNGYFSLFFSAFTMIICGIYSYRAIISIFRSLKELLDPMDDRIEVVDL